MRIEEAMEKMHIDQEVTLGRFCGNVSLLERFIKKFPQDTTFEKLKEGLECKNLEMIENMAHTLKGTSANLGFDQLSQLSANIVMAVRSRQTEDLEKMFQEVSEEYFYLLKCISEID